jgi:hypothetical protein
MATLEQHDRKTKEPGQADVLSRAEEMMRYMPIHTLPNDFFGSADEPTFRLA